VSSDNVPASRFREERKVRCGALAHGTPTLCWPEGCLRAPKGQDINPTFRPAPTIHPIPRVSKTHTRREVTENQDVSDREHLRHNCDRSHRRWAVWLRHLVDERYVSSEDAYGVGWCLWIIVCQLSSTDATSTKDLVGRHSDLRERLAVAPQRTYKGELPQRE